MVNQEENKLKQTFSYITSELNRIQTIAGTLSSTESQHYKDLTNFGDDKLNQVAVEEQSASRQLGEIKQICMALTEKVNELENEFINKNNKS